MKMDDKPAYVLIWMVCTGLVHVWTENWITAGIVSVGLAYAFVAFVEKKYNDIKGRRGKEG